MEFIFGCLLQIDEWKKGAKIHGKKSFSAWAIRFKIKKIYVLKKTVSSFQGETNSSYKST